MTQSETWQAATAKRIGETVRAAREAANPKVTAAELARRVDALGYTYTRNALVNLEGGRKTSVDISELIAIAHALDVPPITLIYPGIPDEPVEYVPEITVDSWTAAKRFAGLDASDTHNQATALLHHHDELLQRVEHSRQELRKAKDETIHDGMRGWTPEKENIQQHRVSMSEDILDFSVKALQRHRTAMRNAGVAPPASGAFADNNDQPDLFHEGDQP